MAVHAMNTVIHDRLPIPLPLMPLVGGFSGLLFGVIFGSVSTRRAGTAFAMISLGLGELVASSSLILRGFFGGEEGVSTNRTKLLRLFDFNFGPQIQVYYLIAGWCLLCMVAMYALTRTPFGRICNAVRENPERAQFVGYNPRTVRFIAFSLAGLFAGIAGALAAINFELVNSSAVGAAQSGLVLLAAFIGGISNFIGPVVGAVLVTWLEVMLSDVTDVWQLYFGLLFIGMVMFAPDGIAGLLMMHQPLWQARAYKSMLRLALGLPGRACTGARAAHRPDPRHRDDLPSQRQGIRGNDDLDLPRHARYRGCVVMGGGCGLCCRGLLSVPPHMAGGGRRVG